MQVCARTRATGYVSIGFGHHPRAGQVHVPFVQIGLYTNVQSASARARHPSTTHKVCVSLLQQGVCLEGRMASSRAVRARTTSKHSRYAVMHCCHVCCCECTCVRALTQSPVCHSRFNNTLPINSGAWHKCTMHTRMRTRAHNSGRASAAVTL